MRSRCEKRSADRSLSLNSWPDRLARSVGRRIQRLARGAPTTENNEKRLMHILLMARCGSGLLPVRAGGWLLVWGVVVLAFGLAAAAAMSGTKVGVAMS